MSRKKNAADPNTAANGRDESGRFALGNRCGPGNPFNRRMAEMRQAMLDAVSPQDLKDIVRQVVVKARLGDLTAAKLVLSYVVGKPGAAVEPDRVDLDEWKLHTDRPTLKQVQGAVAGSLRPDLVNLAVKAADLTVGNTLCDGLAALKQGPAPTDGGLSAAAANGKAANGAHRAPANGKQPVESTDVSILQHLNGLFASPPQGEEGHVIDRIIAEEVTAKRR